MHQRINSRLASWILHSENELRQELQELNGHPPSANELKKARTLFATVLDDENKIKIQTIHAFCQSFIKIFPFEAGISPNFEILEDKQEKILIKQAQKEVLKQAFSNPKLKNLISEINSEINEESFSDLILQLLGKKEFLDNLRNQFFGLENIISEIFNFFNVNSKETTAEICHNFYNNLKISKLLQALENSGVRDKESAQKIKIFLKDPTVKNFTFYKSAFFTDKNEERKLNKKISENSELENIRIEQCQLIRDFSDKLNSLAICHDTALLLYLADNILQEYNKLKKQNSVLDYDDLINKTNKLLANPEYSEWIKLKMDSSFDHILIDESQDTNHQQWSIIKALTEDFFSGLSASEKNRSIFIVGDEKQSIYSFQGAEPNISEEIFAFFKNKLGDKLKKIELNNSFRSLNEILLAVDKVFSKEDHKKAISKIAPFQDHKPIRDGIGKVEIWPQFFDEETEKNNSFEWQFDFNKKEKLSGQEELAEVIARKIKSRVANQEILPSRKKPLRYSDFMVLLRNRTNGFDKTLIKYFHQYKIPFSSLSKIKFSESLMIQDLLAAAKFALLQDDDLNLACLLKSPLFAISEEELLRICLIKNRDKSTIYKALGQVTFLDELIGNAQKFNSFEFFYNLLETNNNRQKIISYFGDEASEILDKFCLAVLEFCSNISPNLQQFLDFVDKFDFEISLNGNDDDCVKIATIHAAKGLQAPVVLMPDCCYNFSQMPSTKEKIIWLEVKEEKFPVYLANISKQNKILENYKREKFLATKEEYLRLLYVAMTRAEDELYIAGFGNSKDAECWYEAIKNALPNVIEKEELIKRYFKKDSLSLDMSLSKGRVFEKTLSHKILEPLRDSRMASVDMVISKTACNQAQIRGKLIHKILEIFGKNYREEKKWLMSLAKNLIENSELLSEKEKNIIHDEVSNFLYSQLFAEIFNGEIKCEVEIAGNGNLFRIDLMRITEDEVLIIDYKSDESLSKAALNEYQKQLLLYCNLAKNIFLNKKISGAILWLKDLKMEMVSDLNNTISTR